MTIADVMAAIAAARAARAPDVPGHVKVEFVMDVMWVPVDLLHCVLRVADDLPWEVKRFDLHGCSPGTVWYTVALAEQPGGANLTLYTPDVPIDDHAPLPLGRVVLS